MSEAEMRFDVRGEGQATLEIDVYDVIGETWDGRGMSAKKMRGILRGNAQAKQIKLRVNSVGGSVFDGFAIYQGLVDHKAKVTAEIDGLAASMASVIIMAADEIHIAPHAMVMIHNPWGGAVGESGDMRKMADLLDKLRDASADAYVARTGIDRDEVIAMMDAETWMNAEEAHAKGFADLIKDAKKKDEEKALARLDLSAFARVPNGFQMAVAQAKSALPKKTVPTATYAVEFDTDALEEAVDEAVRRIDAAHAKSSTAAVGGAPNKEKRMDLETLKAQHPEAFKAAVQEGVNQERDRVVAHLTMGEGCGDISIAAKAIKDGAAMTATLQAEYLSVGMKNSARGARQQETDEAGRAADGAQAPEPDGEGLEAKAKQMAEMTREILGKKVG